MICPPVAGAAGNDVSRYVCGNVAGFSPVNAGTVGFGTATAATVTCAVAFTVPSVAVIVVVPSPTAVMSPLADTVAIELLALVQVNTLPVTALPAASSAVAVACVMPAG